MANKVNIYIVLFEMLWISIHASLVLWANQESDSLKEKFCEKGTICEVFCRAEDGINISANDLVIIYKNDYMTPPRARIVDQRTISHKLEYGRDTAISVGCIDNSNNHYSFERIYIGAAPAIPSLHCVIFNNSLVKCRSSPSLEEQLSITNLNDSSMYIRQVFSSIEYLVGSTFRKCLADDHCVISLEEFREVAATEADYRSTSRRRVNSTPTLDSGQLATAYTDVEMSRTWTGNTSTSVVAATTAIATLHGVRPQKESSQVFRAKVTVSNPFATIVTEYSSRFDKLDRICAPVVDVKPVQVNSSAILLSLTLPEVDIYIRYRVENSQSMVIREDMERTENRNYNLKIGNLQSSTNYIVILDLFSSRNNNNNMYEYLASKSIRYPFKTKQRVPEKPKIIGYSSSSKCSNCSLLFWKLQVHRTDRGLKFRLAVVCSPGNTATATLATDRYQAKVHMCPRGDTLVEIKTVNTAGSSDKTSILIPGDGKVGVPSRIVAPQVKAIRTGTDGVIVLPGDMKYWTTIDRIVWSPQHESLLRHIHSYPSKTELQVIAVKQGSRYVQLRGVFGQSTRIGFMFKSNYAITWIPCIYNGNVKYAAEKIEFSNPMGSDYIIFHWMPNHHDKECLYFVSRYIVQYCIVKRNECEDHYLELEIPASVNSYKILNLKPDSRYRIKLKSIGYNYTVTSNAISTQTLKSNSWKTSSIVYLSIVVISLNICLVIGVANSCLHCLQFKKWYSNGIKIIVPKTIFNDEINAGNFDNEEYELHMYQLLKRKLIGRKSKDHTYYNAPLAVQASFTCEPGNIYNEKNMNATRETILEMYGTSPLPAKFNKGKIHASAPDLPSTMAEVDDDPKPTTVADGGINPQQRGEVAYTIHPRHKQTSHGVYENSRGTAYARAGVPSSLHRDKVVRIDRCDNLDSALDNVLDNDLFNYVNPPTVHCTVDPTDKPMATSTPRRKEATLVSRASITNEEQSPSSSNPPQTINTLKVRRKCATTTTEVTQPLLATRVNKTDTLCNNCNRISLYDVLNSEESTYDSLPSIVHKRNIGEKIYEVCETSDHCVLIQTDKDPSSCGTESTKAAEQNDSNDLALKHHTSLNANPPIPERILPRRIDNCREFSTHCIGHSKPSKSINHRRESKNISRVKRINGPVYQELKPRERSTPPLSPPTHGLHQIVRKSHSPTLPVDRHTMKYPPKNEDNEAYVYMT